MPGPIFKIQSSVGEPIPAGDLQLIPIARSLRVGFPGLKGGLIWNRPLAVVARAKDGTQTVYPIRDVTRLVQLALLGAGLALALGAWLLRSRTP
jgi:hypothetical protein